jgi:hypothetical protein
MSRIKETLEKLEKLDEPSLIGASGEWKIYANKDSEYSDAVVKILDKTTKRLNVIRLLGEKDGLQIFEGRNSFSDLQLFVYDGKDVKKISTKQLFELMFGKPQELCRIDFINQTDDVKVTVKF